MAIHNSIFLFGKIHGQPVVSYDETGKMTKVMLALTVISNKERKTGLENKVSFVTPLVISQNKEIMKIMSELKKDDVVQLKGTIVTKNYTKSSVCKKCGAKNKTEGILSFVNPIYFKAVKTNNTKEEAMKLLRESQEVSNIATIIGTLCQDPEIYKSKNGELTTQYQLAIDRKYRIKEDSPLIRTDYPWVKSFGEFAKMDKMCLEKGSSVFIDGMLQARHFQRKTTCSNEDCKEVYEWADHSLEIIPYQTEYLNNFTTPEEKEATEKEKTENLIRDLLNE